jgi:hypothetical protein
MNARMRIASPGSPNDGKEVEVLVNANGYNAMEDRFDPDFAGVRLVESGNAGGIHKQFLVDI